jgi:hypothetical protein
MQKYHCCSHFPTSASTENTQKYYDISLNLARMYGNQLDQTYMQALLCSWLRIE